MSTYLFPFSLYTCHPSKHSPSLSFLPPHFPVSPLSFLSLSFLLLFLSPLAPRRTSRQRRATAQLSLSPGSGAGAGLLWSAYPAKTALKAAPESGASCPQLSHSLSIPLARPLVLSPFLFFFLPLFLSSPRIISPSSSSLFVLSSYLPFSSPRPLFLLYSVPRPPILSLLLNLGLLSRVYIPGLLSVRVSSDCH